MVKVPVLTLIDPNFHDLILRKGMRIYNLRICCFLVRKIIVAIDLGHILFQHHYRCQPFSIKP